MRSDEIAAKREQRAELRAKMQKIVDDATLEGRDDLTPEEAATFDKASVEYRKLGAELDGAREAGGAAPFETFGGRGTGLAAAFREAGWDGKEPAEIGWAEFRAFTWTGSADNINSLRRESGTLGADQRYVWPAFPQVAVGGDVTSVQVLTQTARSLASAANVVRAIDAVSAKPETGSTMTASTVSMKQVANIQTGVPNVILEQSGADSVIEQDLRLALNDGLDKIVNDTFAASGFQAPGTDPLLISIRKAMTTIQASGYAPSHLLLTPANSEALDTLRATGTATEQYFVFAPAQLAPRDIFGLETRVSKVIAAPVVVDADAYGKLYASPVRLQSFEANSGTTNTSNVRMELHAALGVERQAAAVRIAAS